MESGEDLLQIQIVAIGIGDRRMVVGDEHPVILLRVSRCEINERAIGKPDPVCIRFKRNICDIQDDVISDMLDKLLRHHSLSCRLFYDLSIPIHDEKSGQSKHIEPLFQHVLRGYTFSCERPLDIMQFVDGTVQTLHDRHLIELFRHGILGMHIVGRILHLLLETREIRFPGMNIYDRHDQ